MQQCLSPFLKWPGGKRWLVRKYSEYIYCDYSHYYEPFLGSGAVFFALCPKDATLSDINEELINLFRVMRDDYPALLDVLTIHHLSHSKEYYYRIRDMRNLDSIQAAGRTLYLNRTCYNGMYRINKKGEFNVPIGTKNNCLFDIERFADYSKRLSTVTLESCDFAQTIMKASEGDFIFADPPYATSEKQAGFLKYNETLFSWKDQERLHISLCEAKARGVNIVATNTNHDLLRKLYEESGFYVRILERYSAIASKTEKRCIKKELLITTNHYHNRSREGINNDEDCDS